MIFFITTDIYVDYVTFIMKSLKERTNFLSNSKKLSGTTNNVMMNFEYVKFVVYTKMT